MILKKCSCFILLLFIVFIPLLASADKKPSIAVLDLSLSNVSEETKLSFHFILPGNSAYLKETGSIY